MNKSRAIPWLIGVLAVGLLTGRAGSLAWAGGKSQAAKELAESLLQRFGRQAVREGTEVLATKIEAAAARNGSDVFEAVRKVGPKALPLMEQAGAHGNQAARVMARHGEHGATWVVSRPRAMSLVLRHGDGAAGVLVKHTGGIAEPVVERFGSQAIRALEASGPQSGRRLAMMMADGELAKIGRTEELLEVVARYGDRSMDFIWKNKGPLTVGATLTAFLANPETFLNTAQGVTKTVAENVVRPLADIPGTAVKAVAEGTNWTVVFVVALVGGAGIWAGRVWLRRKLQPQHPRPDQQPKAGM